MNRYRIVNRLVEDSQDELLALDVKNLLSNCLSEFVLLLLQIFVLNQMDLMVVFRIYVKTQILNLLKTKSYVTVVVVAFSWFPDGVRIFDISVSNGSYRDLRFISGIFYGSQ